MFHPDVNVCSPDFFGDFCPSVPLPSIGLVNFSDNATDCTSVRAMWDEVTMVGSDFQKLPPLATDFSYMWFLLCCMDILVWVVGDIVYQAFVTYQLFVRYPHCILNYFFSCFGSIARHRRKKRTKLFSLGFPSKWLILTAFMISPTVWKNTHYFSLWPYYYGQLHSIVLNILIMKLISYSVGNKYRSWFKIISWDYMHKCDNELTKQVLKSGTRCVYLRWKQICWDIIIISINKG